MSARDLSIPDKARKEYQAAQKVLGKRDAAKAIEHLEKAVEIAPASRPMVTAMAKIAAAVAPQARHESRRWL